MAVVVVAFVLRVERGVASVVAAMLRLGADRLRARAPILCDTSTLSRRQAKKAATGLLTGEADALAADHPADVKVGEGILALLLALNEHRGMLRLGAVGSLAPVPPKAHAGAAAANTAHADGSDGLQPPFRMLHARGDWLARTLR